MSSAPSRQFLRFALGLLCALVAAPSARVVAQQEEPRPTTPIRHVISIMQENHTFDNYFGTFPGAEGISPDTCMPVDPFDPTSPDCVRPFPLRSQMSTDLDHSDQTARLQFNKGLMNGFVYALNLRNQEGYQAMGYYDGRDLPYYWNLAEEYVLLDHFFSSAFSGSHMNHLYWVAASPGPEPGHIPPNGYGDLPTIFDRLDENGISWKFYVQNYDPRIHFRAEGNFGNRASQVIWVPLLNYDRYIFDPELSRHIVDLQEYFDDLRNGTLPSVAYIVPSGASEHPPGRVQSGMKFVKSLITALQRSSAWSSSAFILAYDDWGGYYDHVVPPQVDEYGYGFRVPALIVSPYAKRGYIDRTEYDFTSILRFIEDNWELDPLAERDAKADGLSNAFDFAQPARAARFTTSERGESTLAAPKKREPPRVVIFTLYGMVVLLAAVVFAGAGGVLRGEQLLALQRGAAGAARRMLAPLRDVRARLSKKGRV